MMTRRDTLDRLAREQRGRARVFDLPGVARESATQWWDPLSFVTDGGAPTVAVYGTVGCGRRPLGSTPRPQAAS